jgi:hypothetical protein
MSSLIFVEYMYVCQICVEAWLNCQRACPPQDRSQIRIRFGALKTEVSSTTKNVYSSMKEINDIEAELTITLSCILFSE